MKTSSNHTYYFKQIVLEEEQFYGLKKVKGEIVRITISDYETNEVFLPGKSKSTLATIGLVAVPVGFLFLIAKTNTSTATIDLGF